MGTHTLPASAFQPGDLVIGTDEGGTHMGEVSSHHPSPRHPNEVLIYWSGEDYSSSSLGHVCPPEPLRLWPARAHEERARSMAPTMSEPPVPVAPASLSDIVAKLPNLTDLQRQILSSIAERSRSAHELRYALDIRPMVVKTLLAELGRLGLVEVEVENSRKEDRVWGLSRLFLLRSRSSIDPTFWRG